VVADVDELVLPLAEISQGDPEIQLNPDRAVERAL
jgi:hypothetical protein